MPGGVVISNRAVADIRESIPALRIGLIRDNGIRLQEPPQRGRVEARLVVHDAAHA